MAVVVVVEVVVVENIIVVVIVVAAAVVVGVVVEISKLIKTSTYLNISWVRYFAKNFTKNIFLSNVDFPKQRTNYRVQSVKSRNVFKKRIFIPDYVLRYWIYNNSQNIWGKL